MTTFRDPAPFVLLDDSLAPSGAEAALLFTAPAEIVTCTDYDQLDAALARLDAALDAGHHLAGWFAYELGYGFEPRLRAIAPPPGALPLLWVGVFGPPERLEARAIADRLDQARFPADDWANLSAFTPAVTEAVYRDAIAAISGYLHAGDLYQANYTFPVTFALAGTPRSLYRRLRRAQPVPYGAWLRGPERDVLSLSPELFVEKRGNRITARPMKGTAPRGRTAAEDDRFAATLAADPKAQAENVMIVDLLRNDLSRLATVGSVEVPRLFEVERYRTLLQLTSSVTAEVAADLPLATLLGQLFPCGSVTGAPKIRAMEIIRELEPAPRGVYTGAIGHVTPERDFCFNVPIRTLVLTPEPARPGHWRGSLGIGSGIVADSRAGAEYEECLLKGRFLTAPHPDFDLIETLLWSPEGGYRHLDRHLDRLLASARYFAFAADRATITTTLNAFAADLPPEPQRVRLVLGRSGALAATAQAFDPAPPENARIRLSPHRVHSSDPLLYHKTTVRAPYSAALAAARAAGPCFDALLMNERGELTEGSFTNLFIERHGRLLTPPESAGLLPGVLRSHLLATGQATEAVLRPADLVSADRVFLGNALRGLVPVTLA